MYKEEMMEGIKTLIWDYWIKAKNDKPEWVFNPTLCAQAASDILAHITDKGLRVNNLGDIPQGKGTIIFIPDEPLV